MRWKKMGRIFTVDNVNINWMKSHASLPISDVLDKYRIKIYFSSRDENNRSNTGYIIVDMRKPNEILEISKQPVLSPGSLGEFDDSGAMGSCLVKLPNDRQYMYYIGWNLGKTVPFRNSIGLAIKEPGSYSFKKFSNGPIVERNYNEPHFSASCCVLKESKYRMWYLSCIKWEKIDNEIRHYYHIKYAESIDGINWERKGRVAIDFSNNLEYAISTPRVIKENGIYKMWYSFRASQRSKNYRIGYAESKNGFDWIRKDNEMIFDVSREGWDSEMVCYPFIFDLKNSRYMLYNGNRYGKTGIGLAILEDD